jgi:thiol-disulfide isomerase/thioredoxin
MQRERFHRLSGLPRAGKAAQQHGNAAAVHELPREGDECLSCVPGREESEPGEVDHDEIKNKKYEFPPEVPVGSRERDNSMFKMKNILVIIVAVLLVSGVLGCDQFMDDITGDTGGGGSDALLGRPAPLFTLRTMDGSIEDVSSRKGDPIVLAFWSPWCGYCKKQAPLLSGAHAAFKDKGVVFIGVATKGNYEKVTEYIKQYGHLFSNGIDLSGDLSRDYEVRGVPKTVFIDRNGNISYTHLGPISERKLMRAIKKIL